MFKKLLLCATLTAGLAPLAMASNTFQNSCSNTNFVYRNGIDATMTAVCLNAEGIAVSSSLTLTGISNQNGQLTQGSGPSTFQQSCGNIQILVDGPDVTLSAICRTRAGTALETSLPLRNISNNNGSLTQ